MVEEKHLVFASCHDGWRIVLGLAYFSDGALRGPCTVCGQAGSEACGGCRVDFYCGKEHQTRDWKRHRTGCRVLRLKENARLGRHLVVTKDVPAGTVLMRERPLITYPWILGATQQLQLDFAVCVGCCLRLVGGAIRQCGGCGWPVCDERCARRPIHGAECAAFQRAGFKLRSDQIMRAQCRDQMQGLIALRLCLAMSAASEDRQHDEDGKEVLTEDDKDKQMGVAGEAQAQDDAKKAQEEDEKEVQKKDDQEVQKEVAQEGDKVDQERPLPQCPRAKEVADRLLDLQGHLTPFSDAAAGSGHYRRWLEEGFEVFGQQVDSAVSWLLDVVRIDWLDKAALERALGVAILNGISRGSGRLAMGAVFAGLSMVEHACLPNAMSTTSHERFARTAEDTPADAWDDDVGDLVVMACTPLKRGDHVAVSYLQTSPTPTNRRRRSLVWRGFLCRCVLCADPTEAGLYLEAWCCGVCNRPGAPKKSLVVVRDQDRWSCSVCGHSGDNEEVLGGGASVTQFATRFNQLRALDGGRAAVSLADWEKLLDEALWPRGPLHATHHLVLAAKKDIVSPDDRHPRNLAEARRLEAHCRDVVRALRVLQPGVNNAVMGDLERLSKYLAARLYFSGQEMQDAVALKVEGHEVIRGQEDVLKEMKAIAVTCKDSEKCATVAEIIASIVEKVSAIP